MARQGRPASGSIRERKGSLVLRVSLPADPVTGKRRQRQETIEGTSEAAHRRARARLRAMIREVELERDAGGASTSESVGALLDEWLKHSAPQLSGNTVRTNRLNADFYLKPLRSVPVDALTVKDIETLYAKLLSVGADGGRKPLQPVTIRRIHGTLHRALQLGVRWEWCTSNVASLVEHAKVEKKIRAMPDPELLSKFFKEIEIEDAAFATWLRLAAVTGARRGEVCGLRWTDIDFEAGDLLIARVVVVGEAEDGKEECYVRESTKTNKPRRIALGPSMVERLQDHLERCKTAATACSVTLPPDTYLFALEADGREPWMPQRLSIRYRRAAKRHGNPELGDEAIDMSHVRLGDLRHFVASQMLLAGEPVTAVAARLGNSPHTLMANYAHFIPGADREAAQRMENLVT